ncbi:MAG: acyl-CoA thioesterase [Candidatus Promineifilaceae bacterium]|nr:acyl-CoA thioesterase [Candidatus Promineifilaceae bacterium]
MFETSIQVIFRDVDAMGHVNNAVYFTYMETARTQFFAEQLVLKSLAELPLIVAEARCIYQSAARFNENLVVAISVPRIGTKSFDMRYQITGSDRRQVALGKTVMVTYDYGSRTTIPIPQKLRSLLEEHLHDLRDETGAPT